MSVKDSITTQTCKLLQGEFNDFLALYPVPSEYHVILPKSNQTVFNVPLVNFIYIEDDDNLSFLSKEPSLRFGIGSPSTSVNTEPPKDVEEPEVQPAEVIAESRKSLKASVFGVHPGSVAARIKESVKLKT
nr:hypothetical protein [Tanacetum cinerariifolium]